MLGRKSTAEELEFYKVQSEEDLVTKEELPWYIGDPPDLSMQAAREGKFPQGMGFQSNPNKPCAVVWRREEVLEWRNQQWAQYGKPKYAVIGDWHARLDYRTFQYICLAAGNHNLLSLAEKTEKELLAMHGVGRGTVAIIRRILAACGAEQKQEEGKHD
jgi:hypothetical protein